MGIDYGANVAVGAQLGASGIQRRSHHLAGRARFPHRYAELRPAAGLGID